MGNEHARGDAPPEGASATRHALTDQAALDAAIAWRIKLQYNSADAQAWQAFEAWLQAAPLHAQVWERLQALGAKLQRPTSSLPPQAVAQMLRQADAAHTRLSRRKALMAVGGLAVSGALAWQLRQTSAVQHMLADAATQRGERRRLTLPDGGTLILNTDSAVNIAYDAQFRRIELLAGEIYLISGHDAQARPLYVQTRDGRAQALGTRYRVRQFEHYSEVAVDEGAVALWPRDIIGQQAYVTLQAGQAARMTQEDVQALVDDGGLDAAAWTQGSLSVRGMPLANFLQEAARYHGDIQCDPSVARLPVSGVFQLDDTTQLLALLRQSQPIEIDMTRHWWGGKLTRVRART